MKDAKAGTSILPAAVSPPPLNVLGSTNTSSVGTVHTKLQLLPSSDREAVGRQSLREFKKDFGQTLKKPQNV